MKKFQKITGEILILVFTFNMMVPISLAETEPEQKCADKKPNYETLQAEWDEEETKNRKAYDKAFETAQDAYHEYVGCIFSFAEETFKKVFEPKPEEKNWNLPEKACLTPQKLKTLIQSTQPDQMLEPTLTAHNEYKAYLTKLKDDFHENGILTSESGQRYPITDALIRRQQSDYEIKRQLDLEITNSLVALDLAFASLKEFRLSTVMHVHFQCTLFYLDKYRKSVSRLRSIIEVLPGQLRDASVTK